MPTTKEKMLIATDEEQELEARFPIIPDTGDAERVEDHHRARSMARVAIAGLTAALFLQSGLLLYFVPKHIVNHWWRILPSGEIESANINDTVYIGRPQEARLYLLRWAHYRYDRKRTAPRGSTPIHEFGKTYVFYSNSKDNNILAGMQNQDDDKGLITDVVSGDKPEQVLNTDPDVVFESFGAHVYHGQTYYGGRAVLNMVINIAAMGEQKAHSIRLITALDFYLNPGQVELATANDPEYQNINGAGLTIVSYPLEQILAVNSQKLPEADHAPRATKK